MAELPKFDNLSKKNQQKVQNLINKLAAKQNTTEEGSVGGKERNVRRPPITQVKKIPPSTVSVQNKISNRPSHTQHSRKPEKGSPARVQPLHIDDRPNLFVDAPDGHWLKGVAHLAKSDTKIDKKLIGSNTPTPRARTETIEVACNICKEVYEVSQKLVYSEGKEIRFTCDDCLGRR